MASHTPALHIEPTGNRGHMVLEGMARQSHPPSCALKRCTEADMRPEMREWCTQQREQVHNESSSDVGLHRCLSQTCQQSSGNLAPGRGPGPLLSGTSLLPSPKETVDQPGAWKPKEKMPVMGQIRAVSPVFGR